MTPWDMQANNEGTNVFFEKDGRRETFDFEPTKTLFDAVKEIADRKSLTAVNVLVNNEEVGEQEGRKRLSEFAGSAIKVVPKNTGSNSRD